MSTERRARPILGAGLLLAAVAAGVVAILALVHRATQAQIERNQHEFFLTRLAAMVPPGSYDNDLLADRIDITAPDVFGSAHAVPVYRARRNGEPVAAIFTTIAPDGYGGPIELLIAVRADGELLGVSVVAHRETPGLGDAFERGRSSWLDAFAGRSLGDPPAERWTVRKDGGAFDQFTGATITPRAIILAVRRTLEFCARAGPQVFADRPLPTDAATARDVH
jgi:electron transport complex protein RnfG